MTPEQFLQKCEAAFAADEPQVIPAAVARAMCRMTAFLLSQSGWYDITTLKCHLSAFTAACKEIEA